uniref:Uncharacterized protein n=1 Tax=Heliothis virescens TaxID=7102 RepID=A0A2A4JB26_HELVI
MTTKAVQLQSLTTHSNTLKEPGVRPRTSSQTIANSSHTKPHAKPPAISRSLYQQCRCHTYQGHQHKGKGGAKRRRQRCHTRRLIFVPQHRGIAWCGRIASTSTAIELHESLASAGHEKKLMEQTPISEYLFGDKLQDKVNAIKAVKKSGQDLKNSCKSALKPKNLNFRGHKDINCLVRVGRNRN